MQTVRFDSVAGSDMDRAMKIIRFRMHPTQVTFKVVPWFQNRRKGAVHLAKLFSQPNEIVLVSDKRGDVAQTPVFRGFLEELSDEEDSIVS